MQRIIDGLHRLNNKPITDYGKSKGIEKTIVTCGRRKPTELIIDGQARISAMKRYKTVI